MIRSLLAGLLVMAASSAFAEPRLTGAGAQILRSHVGGGGEISTGGGLSLDSSVGEGLIASTNGGAFKVEAGVVPVLSQPGSVVSIVAATKSTGTLNLAWTAPGRDGSVGANSGFYRIDYSSDPAHAFDPTTYAVEFATSVVPGAAQEYRLTGLLPNTTYYSRIYLADARKFVAETSAPSEESTYANGPVAPAFSSVNSTSVTITWAIPLGGAEAFGAFASSTGYGPNGNIVSTRTPNGVIVTLTVTGLEPYSDYFFRMGGYNWQSQFNYDSVISTKTRPGAPLAPKNVQLIADSLNRTILVTWTNPVFANPAGVTVVVSTSPIVFTPTDATPYPVGSIVDAGGAIVKSSAPTPTSAYFETNLQLDVTAYFTLFSRDGDNYYSIGTSTQLVLDLPPMGAPGLTAAMTADGSSLTLRWSSVVSNMDGTMFKGGIASGWELDRYEVWRSTGIMRPTWVFVGTCAATATQFDAPVPTPGGLYFYKVVTRDRFQGNWTDFSPIVDTMGAYYALGGDGVSRLRVSPQAASMVTPAGNASGQPLLIRAKDRPSDLGGRIVKSLDFEPVSAPFNMGVPIFQGNPDASVVLRYETNGGVVVPSAVGVAGTAPPLVPSVSIANASNGLAAYFVGTGNAAKVYGRIDTINQTVTLETGLVGNYQIRTVLRDQAFNFDLSGVSNKVITPNGDGLNDTVVFTFENPRQSAVSGKVYDVRGTFVADMPSGPMADTLVWDGKASGLTVPQGVYIYQIKSEGKTVNGTVVVIR